MKIISRRDFLKFAAVSAVYSASQLPIISAQGRGRVRNYHGINLEGWELAVGDARFVAPGETDISLADIATIQQTPHSTLRANIHTRRIMAHNITFKRSFDNDALNFVHKCRVQFRLPYMPSQSNGIGSPEIRNAETFDVGLFIWDGQLDYGMAFSWLLNPWTPNVGNIRQWNGGTDSWVDGASLPIDTNWHTAELTVNFQQAISELLIDGIPYPSQFTAEPKEFSDSRVAARFQVEAISLFPGTGNGTLHEMDVKNWHWKWEA
jgi:hypothetical protein